MTVEYLSVADGTRPTGRIADGRVDADNVWTADRDFILEAEELDDATAIGVICQDAFALGVSVRGFVVKSSELSSIEAELSRFEDRVESVTETAMAAITDEMERITQPESGVLAGAVAKEMAGLRDVVDEAFDENDKSSALSRIESAVEIANEEMLIAASASIRGLLDSTNPESPMSALRSSIVTDLQRDLDHLAGSMSEMKEVLQIRDAVADEAEKGTQKGVAFEMIVAGSLSDAAAATGDSVTATGTDAGAIPNSKVGDLVANVTSPSGGTTAVVFECKDRKLSAKKIREELNTAIENRQAQAGVMVFASEDQTPYGAPLIRIGSGLYSVVLDKNQIDDLALKVAYQMARADAMATTVDSSAEVDLGMVAERLGEARGKLNEVTRVKQGIGKARAGLDQAETAVVGMRAALEELLSAVTEELTGAS